MSLIELILYVARTTTGHLASTRGSPSVIANREASRSMGPLPPGTLLQIAYLRERLGRLAPGRFLEVGVGQGHVSRTLLEAGWEGAGCDLNEETVERARENLADLIAAGGFDAYASDWLSEEAGDRVDLVISSMVIEHLDETDERAYLDRCAAALNPGGRIILIVPASPRHWGIEDDLAGHMRRYTQPMMQSHLQAAGWTVEHMAGLTYPLSNMVLPISNALVKSSEGHLIERSMDERTRASGDRSVSMKTRYPSPFRLLLNQRALMPFHLLQKRFRDNPNCLVLYAEASPPASIGMTPSDTGTPR